MDFFSEISKIKTIDGALAKLEAMQPVTTKIQKALDDSIRFHDQYFRKSGEPYVVHPICVACIVAHCGGDEDMVCAALLHDAVEDTDCKIDYIKDEYGDEVCSLVDALTKIVEIRKEELTSDSNNEKLILQASSFRKMLIASIHDARVLVIKICDRLHNMLTLDALSEQKQKRIAKETLVVYAPIAHRLGISSLKNELEDKSFYYTLPDDYNKIQNEKNAKEQDLKLRLNQLTERITNLLLSNGFLRDNFKIQSRIKRNYSIHLKMQRKGISMDEMFDLLAIRIIVKNKIDCYRALGIVHIHLNPIPSRFKDYVALPKENGYQTIHTTVFDESCIYEIQIRTFDMHDGAELGMAAHWKYKSGNSNQNINLKWIKDIKENSDIAKNAQEFYEATTSDLDLYRTDIVVFGPDGRTFALPSGSVVLDYAYAVHSDIGDKAEKAFVNNQRASLIQKLKSGDIVRIEKGDTIKARHEFINSVKTSKAKIRMRIVCQNKTKEIDKRVAINILSTIFEKERSTIEESIRKCNFESKLEKAATDIAVLKEIKNRFKQEYNIDSNFFSLLRFKTLKLKDKKFDNLILYTNRNIHNLTFSYCCHPKFGDSIVALKKDQIAIVHHKLCHEANKEIYNNAQQLFIEWTKDTRKRLRFIVSFENRRGVIAEVLTILAKNGYDILQINYEGKKRGEDVDTQTSKDLKNNVLCEIVAETEHSNKKKVKDILEGKYQIKMLSDTKDAYQE